MKDYVHYSDNENLSQELLDTTPHAIRSMKNFKPAGLWVSHDEEDGWSQWCKRNNFGNRSYKYKIIIKGETNLLRINNADELMEFHSKYKTIAFEGGGFKYYTIDWIKVFYEYDGIMIFPYIYTMRFADEVFWYHGWDCASGCIWRPSGAIEKCYRVE